MRTAGNPSAFVLFVIGVGGAQVGCTSSDSGGQRIATAKEAETSYECASFYMRPDDVCSEDACLNSGSALSAGSTDCGRAYMECVSRSGDPSISYSVVAGDLGPTCVCDFQCNTTPPPPGCYSTGCPTAFPYCGPFTDNCGNTIDCGTCPPPCQSTGCGSNCGTITDNCGNSINCGACGGGGSSGGFTGCGDLEEEWDCYMEGCYWDGSTCS